MPQGQLPPRVGQRLRAWPGQPELGRPRSSVTRAALPQAGQPRPLVALQPRPVAVRPVPLALEQPVLEVLEAPVVLGDPGVRAVQRAPVVLGYPPVSTLPAAAGERSELRCCPTRLITQLVFEVELFGHERLELLAHDHQRLFLP